ncbi:hypothetical protein M231_04460 [Tremella mesenterica]|uniref:Uncharacterized protein n=1 Tax=Tremella mesenterica TaxID=5217 RepID=A0A4V1M3W5_TREME|nr:hypothetical protein M231_04460 [Tremella mesenterica]
MQPLEHAHGSLENLWKDYTRLETLKAKLVDVKVNTTDNEANTTAIEVIDVQDVHVARAPTYVNTTSGQPIPGTAEKVIPIPFRAGDRDKEMSSGTEVILSYDKAVEQLDSEFLAILILCPTRDAMIATACLWGGAPHPPETKILVDLLSRPCVGKFTRSYEYHLKYLEWGSQVCTGDKEQTGIPWDLLFSAVESVCRLMHLEDGYDPSQEVIEWGSLKKDHTSRCFYCESNPLYLSHAWHGIQEIRLDRENASRAKQYVKEWKEGLNGIRNVTSKEAEKIKSLSNIIVCTDMVSMHHQLLTALTAHTSLANGDNKGSEGDTVVDQFRDRLVQLSEMAT